ncbi:STAS domain-containing protein [Streptomyces sp. NPDC012637]|uniref:STAS domain-containing protein n=1 Tax=Streptomyces sp. NPDC012637 TaxID=3364842 RepID=UPI0036E30857
MTSQFDRPLPAAVEHINGTLRPSVVAVVCEPGAQRVAVRVCGEIDMEDADGLRRDLTAALDSSPCGLDIDLSAVTFCDSQGLHVLSDLNRQARKAGKTLVLTAPSRPVARLLRVTGAQHLLTVRGWPLPETLAAGTGPARFSGTRPG